MRVCGVEINANDAVLCLLELDRGLFDLPDCRVRKLSLPKENTAEQLRQFQFAFAKLMEDYKVQIVAIKERPLKGKFAGGALGFKMEAAIQLVDSLTVTMLSPQAIKSVLAEYPLPLAFSDTGLKNFQEGAFLSAYAAHYIDKVATTDREGNNNRA